VSAREVWAGLSPNAKRATVLAAAAGVVLVLAGGSMLIAPTEGDKQGSPQDELVRTILTDADPRSLGMEALANRIESMEGRMDVVVEKLDKLAAREPAPAPPGDPALTGEAITEQQAEISAEIERLNAQIETLRGAVDEAGRRPSPTPAPVAPPAEATEPRPRPSPPARETGPPTMDTLFGPPRTGSSAPGTTSQAAEDAFGRTLSGGGGRAGALQIRTVVAAEQQEGSSQSGPRKPRPGEVFIPAGSILSGILLNGTDMPTAQNAREQPTPVLVRIKDLAILPNRVRTDVRECFLITAGYGDLASERAYLRGETFSCVRTDGGVIEVALDGYAVGEDGKVGMRGRLVSKQGAMLAKAMQAGFLQSFAQLFNRMPTIPVSTGNNEQAQLQSMLSSQAMGAAAAQGAAGAMDRLANYYMDMAEQMFPVIEVDAGRGVEFILNKGVYLKIST